jgi:hypothetical protein
MSSTSKDKGAAEDTPPHGQILVYAAADGRLKIEVRLEDESVWLTQQHMADLFQTSKQNVGQHLKHIFEEGELSQNSVVKDFFTTAADGKNYRTSFYNLVEQYLVFAEGQAMRRVPMHMSDWITKLHGFLTLNDRAVLTHAGKISHELAKEFSEAEYEKFHSKQIAQADQDGGDFDQAVKQLPPRPKITRGKK